MTALTEEMPKYVEGRFVERDNEFTSSDTVATRSGLRDPWVPTESSGIVCRDSRFSSPGGNEVALLSAVGDNLFAATGGDVPLCGWPFAASSRSCSRERLESDCRGKEGNNFSITERYSSTVADSFSTCLFHVGWTNVRRCATLPVKRYG